MYYADEVRSVEEFGAPDVELKEAEVKVAHQLIEALAAEWDPEKYHDTFQDNLKKLIETKLEGGTVAEVEKPKKTCPSRRFDGRAQTKPGGYGRKEEAGGAGARGSFRRKSRGKA